MPRLSAELACSLMAHPICFRIDTGHERSFGAAAGGLSGGILTDRIEVVAPAVGRAEAVR